MYPVHCNTHCKYIADCVLLTHLIKSCPVGQQENEYIVRGFGGTERWGVNNEVGSSSCCANGITVMG